MLANRTLYAVYIQEDKSAAGVHLRSYREPPQLQTRQGHRQLLPRHSSCEGPFLLPITGPTTGASGEAHG